MNLKSSCSIALLVAVLATAGPVSAGEEGSPQPASAGEARSAMGLLFAQDVAPEASDAVKVVDAFSAAIREGRLADAAQLLDPQVLILESGGSERSREEYMSSHASADAAFMHDAKQQLRYRKARVQGNAAWVATESTIDAVEDGKHTVLLSTETMLLAKIGNDWKVVHIHWSSRRAKGS